MSDMLITLAVAGAAGDPLGVKEALAMDLEQKYGGSVRVVQVDVREPEQLEFYKG